MDDCLSVVVVVVATANAVGVNLIYDTGTHFCISDFWRAHPQCECVTVINVCVCVGVSYVRFFRSII